MSIAPRLNQQDELARRLEVALRGAVRLDVAVAYAKLKGVQRLADMKLPARCRFLVGTGFAITEPAAVEHLATLGQVRVVVDSPRLAAAAFHPKLYLVEGKALTVFSGSANLTRGGLTTNVEHYDELRVTGKDAAAQNRRFEQLWELGVDFAELTGTGAWEAYRELAAVRTAREREFAVAQRRASDRVHQLLGRDLADRAGPILGEATGFPVEGGTYAHVRLDERPGTKTIQRAGIEIHRGDFELRAWPAELKPQAEAFYGTDAARALLRFVSGRSGWEIEPRPHLAFRLASRGQRAYLTPRLDARAYVRRWEREDLGWAGGHAADELFPDLWNWLLARGHASRADKPEVERFAQILGTRVLHLRPGMRVRRIWPREQAERLDRQGRLAGAVRDALDQLLDALGEPPLP